MGWRWPVEWRWRREMGGVGRSRESENELLYGGGKKMENGAI